MTALLTWLTVAAIELVDDYANAWVQARERREWRAGYRESLKQSRCLVDRCLTGD